MMVFLLLTMVSSSPTLEDNIQVILAVGGDSGEEEEGRRMAEDLFCNEGEILLDIKVTTAGADYYDWQVIDDTTGPIVASCPPVPPETTTTTATARTASNLCYWTSQGEFHDQVCVPAACSRFVSGEHSLDESRPATSLIEVRYGDEEVIILNERFNSLRLVVAGQSSCEIECSMERELELFLFDVNGRVGIPTENSTLLISDHNWIISKVDSILLGGTTTTTTDSMVMMEDTTTITVQDGSRPLTYHR